MNRKLCTLVAALATLLVSNVSPLAYASETTEAKMPAPHASTAQYKTIFHVADGDPKKWNQALNNALNVQQALGKNNGEIEIVVNGGDGIGMLKLESAVGSRVQEALSNGVKILACESTMKNVKLTKDDMLPNIGYTPSAVVKVMQRQQDGWSYVRN